MQKQISPRVSGTSQNINIVVERPVWAEEELQNRLQNDLTISQFDHNCPSELLNSKCLDCDRECKEGRVFCDGCLKEDEDEIGGGIYA